MSILISNAVTALLVAGIFLTGCAPEPKPSPAVVAPLSVEVTQVKPGPITRSISLPAQVRANQQAVLYAKITGYLKRCVVDRGDSVKAGDLIAELEAPELQADAARAHADVQVARTDFERLSEAGRRAPDLVVPLTVENARAKFEMAQATALRQETLLGFTQLKAPFPGTITKRWADIGALIPAATASSSPAASAVVTLMDFSVVRAEVDVPEPEVPPLRSGMSAELRVDELPGKLFSGQISRLGYALDETTKCMPIEIDIPNPEGALHPGMFGTAKLTVGSKASTPLLPIDTLVTEKTRTSVFLLVDGKAHKVPVKVGFEDGKNFEVIEGVASDAQVIRTGKLPLLEGMVVERKEAK